MTLSVRKALIDDCYSVCRLLKSSTLNSNWIKPKIRKRMFEHPWGAEDENYFGYVLEDDGELVGYIGLLFTEQPINGVLEKCCEVHSWYVKDPYRKESLKLFLPVLSIKKMTLLNYTPTQDVYEISKKFGFQDLEKKIRLIYPLPTVSFKKRYKLIKKEHDFLNYLNAEQIKLINDHSNTGINFYVIVDSFTNEYCLILIKRMRRKWFEPFARVLYVSSQSIFINAISDLRLSICVALKAQCLVINDDDINGISISGTRLIDREVPSVIKSKKINPQEVKPLYSLPLLIGYGLH